MQLSSALPSKQLGSIFHIASTFLLPSFVLCLLYATYLSQPVILPNKTTSLGKKGQFEGSLPGLPEPEFLSRANIYPGPVSCQKQTKDSCCRKYRQWSLNPFRLRNREGDQQNETSRKPLLLQRTSLSISNAAQHKFWFTFTFTGEPPQQRLKQLQDGLLRTFWFKFTLVSTMSWGF